MTAGILIGAIIAIVCGKFLLTFITIYKNPLQSERTPEQAAAARLF